MGRQSHLKKPYDSFACEYFSNAGWQAWDVPQGPWRCDLLAHRDREIAIVEVKSPGEDTVVLSHPDANKLLPIARGLLPPDFASHRRRIAAELDANLGTAHSLPLVKLYAITVACQLRRYACEFEDRKNQYEKAIGGGTVRLSSCSYDQLLPYVVVPVEFKTQVLVALEFLRDKCGFLEGGRAICSYEVEAETDRVLVSRVWYP